MNKNNYTLITGACGGLGKEFVKILAASKENLILVGTSNEKLKHLLEDLKTEINDISIRTMVCDLSKKEDIVGLVEKINDVFTTVQDRQKRLLSMLLTVEIIKACDEDLDKAKNVLTGKELFNEEVFDYYKKHGELPTAKQIGEILGVSEQSLSRTYKNFKEKLK